MTLVELKKSIHKKVDELDDTNFLELVNAMMDNKDQIFQIPENHLTDINQGMQDIKNGDFLTIDDFEKRYERWLTD
ncbi:hypothetical protein [Mucilaginibacter glaciei]|uniref:Uncharacterized protein n=1 Tax=Mucilaginibacter glaciei TaxID=2772109 RepID=A0A926NKA5_9SPHI|nr:hypothetical protein [Mucilaginibacter glaciei]MBD1393629.1 hypothetical protein [Mucilaginibacter glaciei]